MRNYEIHLEIDEAVIPVAQPARRIPHSMKQVVNTKLEEMRKQGIIEKFEGATPWLSSLVVIPKKCGDVRLVVDMRKANTAFKRRRIQIPTVNEILQKMQGATVFTDFNEAQEAAFQKLKTTISSAPVLAHYNLNVPTKLVVDASPWAVGAILLQQQPDTNYHPVAYGSRSLTSTEVKYGHIEKEALALVYGCERFDMYVYGRKFELETDHKPLEYIFQPKASKPPPARIERWQLRLQ